MCALKTNAARHANILPKAQQLFAAPPFPFS
jgi:hypothetical protein